MIGLTKSGSILKADDDDFDFGNGLEGVLHRVLWLGGVLFGALLAPSKSEAQIESPMPFPGPGFAFERGAVALRGEVGFKIYAELARLLDEGAEVAYCLHWDVSDAGFIIHFYFDCARIEVYQVCDGLLLR